MSSFLLIFSSPWQMVKAEDVLSEKGVSACQTPVPSGLAIPCAFALMITASRDEISQIRELTLPTYIYEMRDDGNPGESIDP